MGRPKVMEVERAHVNKRKAPGRTWRIKTSHRARGFKLADKGPLVHDTALTCRQAVLH